MDSDKIDKIMHLANELTHLCMTAKQNESPIMESTGTQIVSYLNECIFLINEDINPCYIERKKTIVDGIEIIVLRMTFNNGKVRHCLLFENNSRIQMMDIDSVDLWSSDAKVVEFCNTDDAAATMLFNCKCKREKKM